MAVLQVISLAVEVEVALEMVLLRLMSPWVRKVSCNNCDQARSIEPGRMMLHKSREVN